MGRCTAATAAERGVDVTWHPVTPEWDLQRHIPGGHYPTAQILARLYRKQSI